MELHLAFEILEIRQRGRGRGRKPGSLGSGDAGINQRFERPSKTLVFHSIQLKLTKHLLCAGPAADAGATSKRLNVASLPYFLKETKVGSG